MFASAASTPPSRPAPGPEVPIRNPQISYVEHRPSTSSDTPYQTDWAPAPWRSSLPEQAPIKFRPIVPNLAVDVTPTAGLEAVIRVIGCLPPACVAARHLGDALRAAAAGGISG
jgi:hypothetical protein